MLPAMSKIVIGAQFVNRGRVGTVVNVVRTYRGTPYSHEEGRFLVDYGAFRRWHRLEDWEGRDGAA